MKRPVNARTIFTFLLAAFAVACASTSAPSTPSDAGSGDVGLAGTACSYDCGGIGCNSTCDGSRLLVCKEGGTWSFQQDCAATKQSCKFVLFGLGPEGAHNCVAEGATDAGVDASADGDAGPPPCGPLFDAPTGCSMFPYDSCGLIDGRCACWVSCFAVDGGNVCTVGGPPVGECMKSDNGSAYCRACR